MIERIRARPHPAKQIVDAAEVIDAPGSRSTKDGRVDLSYARSVVRLSPKGMEQAINLMSGRVDDLIAQAVFHVEEHDGRHTLLHTPSWTRNDYFTGWAEDQPKPTTVEEFDRIYEVRGLLTVDITCPHPPHIIEGAGEFLAERGIDRSEEFINLLHCTLKADDPSNRAFKKWSDRGGSNAQRGTATIEQVRRLLPEGLSSFEGTALDDDLGEDLSAPNPKILWELAQMGPLRTCAIIHLFALAATVPSESYMGRTIIHLRRLDQMFAESGDAEGDLRMLVRLADQDSSDGRRALVSLSAWVAMSNALDVHRGRLPEELVGELHLPGRSIAVEIAAATAAVRRRTLRRGDGRLETSSSLADGLPVITRGLDRRYRELEELLEIVRATRARLEQGDDPSAPIVQRTLEIDQEGTPTGQAVRHRYRLWRCTALLQTLADETVDLNETLAVIRNQAEGGKIPRESEFMLVFEGTDATHEPWFIPLFRYDAFGGVKVLPTSVREGRYDLIARAELPGTRATPEGVLDFRKNDKAIARAAILHGMVPVAVEEFAIAMRIAHTVFNVGIVTAARAGEILQMRMDGANFEYEPDHDLVCWVAIPKQSVDRPFPEPTTSRTHLDDGTLAMIVELRDAMRELIGEEAATSSIPPYATLKDRVPPAPWLLRSAVKPYDPGLLKLLLRYLAFGIANFGVHDIRAAVAKHRLDRGDSLHSIKDLLGHRSEKMSMAYSKPTQTMKERRMQQHKEMSEAEARLERLDKVRRRM
ncbi:hypothetical protein [Roseibium sp.]|uniref:hypothetical protein n=1 Tax=Roseibium sp. TaxID=1936156 RepID=UPI0032970BA9